MKYFNTPLSDEFNRIGGDINVLISPRGYRKTTDIQLHFVEQYLLHGELFLVCRRKIDEEIKASWFSEYAIQQLNNINYKITIKKITRYLIQFNITNVETDETDIIGYGAYLSVSDKYKSNYYENCTKIKNVVLEECIDEYEGLYNIHSKKHLIRQLMSITSTLARHNNIKYWLLGNDIANGYNSNLCYDLNIIDDLTPNKIHQNIYVSLDNIKFKVVYKYFGDIKKLQWLKELHNYSLDNNYKSVKQTQYKIIYKNTEYYLYYTDNYISICKKIKNDNLYTDDELLKKINPSLDVNNNGLNFAHAFFTKEFLKYFDIKFSKNKIEYQCKKITKETSINNYITFNLDEWKNKTLLENIKSKNSENREKLKDFIEQQNFYICNDLSLLINLKKCEVV